MFRLKVDSIAGPITKADLLTLRMDDLEDGFKEEGTAIFKDQKTVSIWVGTNPGFLNR